jgi:arylsulfatase A-like enzyme
MRIFALLLLTLSLHAIDRPNIVWIVSEDNSIHYLKHFFAEGTSAPNIESMAAAGLTFDHAFSNAPVCSVARTTLATSCFGPRVGTQFHRKYRQAEMPTGLKMFTGYLMDAGYYCSNRSKTDYNAKVDFKQTWNASSNKAHWRNRAEGQPFFHMESHGQSHEGSLHFSRATYENEKTTTDPATVALPAYLPDTPLSRYTVARYHDRMTVIDGIVGNTLAQLKADGILEDTFVFYFGDHGGVLPRSKGYIYESGLHVPLVVRIPKNFAHLVDAKAGTRVKGFVSFIDFGPTALNLAGVTPPAGIDGRAFLGKGSTLAELNGRDEAFGYCDRFDEKYELIRSLRKGKYQYIRYYQPYLPDALNNNYRYKMLAFAEWRELAKAGQLSGPQLQFFQRKPIEALYDCEADPHQINNLATDPAQATRLRELRNTLTARLKAMPDLSFYPESYLQDKLDDATGFGQAQTAHIAELIDLANAAFLPIEQALPKLRAAMADADPWKRYWAAMTAAAIGDPAAPLADSAAPLLKDANNMVRVRAAEFLGGLRKIDPQPVLREIVNSSQNAVEATEALNAVVHFRDLLANPYPIDIATLNPASKGADVMDRWNYLNGEPYPPRKKPAKKPKKKN